ncbi:MAG: iron chelate uptake ABC transporter family permease subunit [Candidatus Binatia bacterium]
MALPATACLLLAGIHVYLGIHVIERKVIFVDLALAQIAALGSVYALVLGYDHDLDAWVIKGFSLAFAILGAAVFSLTRQVRERVPQEAVIGISYAVALSAALLASAHLPHGADEMRRLLSGSILWVEPATLQYTGLLYAAVGLFHFVFRERFLLISLHPETAGKQGINLRLWDFLFYVSFAVVVTSSVAIAGVLLVFAYLIVPAATAVLFSDEVRSRLLIGWTIGALVSLCGVSLSYFSDLPSGPLIVVCLVGFLVLAALYRSVRTAAAPLRRSLYVGLASVLVLALALATTRLGPRPDNDIVKLAGSRRASDRIAAIGSAMTDGEDFVELRSYLPRLLNDSQPAVRLATIGLVSARRETTLIDRVLGALHDVDDRVREAAIRCIANIGDRRSTAALLAALGTEEDEYLRVELAHAMVELGDPRGFPTLIDIMDSSALAEVRKEALHRLSSHADVPIAFDPELSPEQNDAAVGRIRAWWARSNALLRWDPQSRKFSPAATDR